MNNIIFVAGTDTDVGKTIFSNLYSIYLKEKLNKNVILSKPIQSGCIKDKISDLKLYFKLGGAKENSQNSYCLKTPCSIDYASKIDRVHLNKKKIINDIPKKYLEGIAIKLQPIFGKRGYSIGHYAQVVRADLLVMNAPSKVTFWDRLFPHDIEHILTELPTDVLIIQWLHEKII